MIDFKVLGMDLKDTQVLSPRDIFGSLTNKDLKYDYLRDVQSEVMEDWFGIRERKDSIIKMNTGSGKTVLGLLILKSCLSENKKPAVYVAPDNYLMEQVIKEANSLGIEVTDNISSSRFLSGKEILVINIHKLINGFSKFGINQKNISIGSIVIDDAHACLDWTEEQFTLRVSKESPSYSELYKIFENDLKDQCEAKVLDLNEGESDIYMQVPFWTWKDNISEIRKIILSLRDDEKNKFKLDLIKNDLDMCNCVVGSSDIEISPKFIPIDVIPSFFDAERRIFMTATLSDDTILATHFGVDLEKVERIISPKKSNDIGERMILSPQELNSEISDEEIRTYLLKLSKEYNVVVIVPSNYRYEFWKDVADQKLDASNLKQGILELKSRRNGLTILINKYDGIDLPKDACHILVIDNLPDIRRKIDKIKDSSLRKNSNLQNRLIHKIEQGMGRGIRSQNDYCVIFLLGKKLIETIYADDAIENFSIATKTQFEISERLSDQIKNKSLDELTDVIDYCLKRDKEWMQLSRNKLINIDYDKKTNVRKNVLSELKAFNYYRKKNVEKTKEILLNESNSTSDEFMKGWLLQELAFYINSKDPVEAQKVLISAQKFNSQLLKPIEGIQHSKISVENFNQGQQIIDYINDNKLESNKLILKVNGILEDLIFEYGTSNKFEEALKNIARILGFKSQRPEKEYGKGPDVLWCIGQLEFLVIECKNGATSEYISKHDCNQLNGSREWFKKNYDDSCKNFPIMIHPSVTFDDYSSPNENILIIDEEKLVELKKNIKEFVKSISLPENYNNIYKISKLLVHYSFSTSTFIPKYFKKFKQKK